MEKTDLEPTLTNSEAECLSQCARTSALKISHNQHFSIRIHLSQDQNHPMINNRSGLCAPKNQNLPKRPRLHHLHFLVQVTLSYTMTLIHRIWNNFRRNRKVFTIKNHSKLRKYQIIYSSAYTHRESNCTPSNIDTFLSNISYHHICHTVENLFSNHFLIILSF